MKRQAAPYNPLFILKCIFYLQVVLAIAHVSQPLSSVVVQELQVGDGTDALQDGDAAEMKYTGWVFSNGQLGQVGDILWSYPLVLVGNLLPTIVSGCLLSDHCYAFTSR